MLSKDYVLGFVEGEGCFNIGIGKYIDRKPRKTNRINKIKRPRLFRISPNFRITQVIDDGYNVLKEVQETLGIGSFQIQKRTTQDGNQRDVAYYYVQNFEDCLKIKDYFKDMTFHTAKGKSFDKWCQCLKIIQEGRHLTKEGILEICDIRDTMNYRKVKCKWSKEEVAQVLELKPSHFEAHFQPEQTRFIHNDNSIKPFDQQRHIRKKQGNNKHAKKCQEIALNTSNS